MLQFKQKPKTEVEPLYACPAHLWLCYEAACMVCVQYINVLKLHVIVRGSIPVVLSPLLVFLLPIKLPLINYLLPILSFTFISSCFIVCNTINARTLYACWVRELPVLLLTSGRHLKDLVSSASSSASLDSAISSSISAHCQVNDIDGT